MLQKELLNEKDGKVILLSSKSDTHIMKLLDSFI